MPVQDRPLLLQGMPEGAPAAAQEEVCAFEEVIGKERKDQKKGKKCIR